MNLKEELFQHISQEHGIDLLDSELEDIIRIVCKHKNEAIETDFKSYQEKLSKAKISDSHYKKMNMAIIGCQWIVEYNLKK